MLLKTAAKVLWASRSAQRCEFPARTKLIRNETDRNGRNPNGVSLPDNFRSKSPRSATKWRWQYLFPAAGLSQVEGGPRCRHHRLRDGFTDAIREAADRAEIEQRVTSHILRHSYATHAHEMGVSMRTLQVLLGHSDIRTTEIYVHASKDGATASRSPIEALAHVLANPPSKPKSNLRLHAG
jgi:integrase